MIKEEKNIDFYTTGRQPTEQDFARISELIKKEKQQKTRRQTKREHSESTLPNKSIAKSGA